MLLEQRQWSPSRGWVTIQSTGSMQAPQLVLLFGAGVHLWNISLLSSLQARYPGALFLGCSTAGEIAGTSVFDGSLVATAVHFEHTQLQCQSASLRGRDCFEAGRELASRLDPRGLTHAFVLSDGQDVNGSALTEGLVAGLPLGVALTGGMAGDGTRFERTLVLLGAPQQAPGVVLLGLYGSRLRVGYGSKGGWDPFGPERLVTRATQNVLYELDGQSALRLYKQYLGEYAADLPASAQLFPLSLRSEQGGIGVVRTVLAISEEEQSMTFAGDIPMGCFTRLMKANSERLLEGARDAANASALELQPELALLVSCVGRKMVLKQRVEEELEGVREVLGAQTVLAGFYSYGELSPFQLGGRCKLHNQTMTITTLREL